MKRLDRETRARCLHALCEGMAIRAVSRLTGASKTTLLKLVEDAGRAAAWYQDRVFHNLYSKRIQVNEIWGFVGAKQKNVANAKRKDLAYGDAWLWVATDADTKLVPSWLVGGRDSEYAMAFMDDLASRLANRVQLTSDGHKAYLEAVEGAFGGDIDYAMLVKIYGNPPEGEKRYSPAECIGAVKYRIEGNPDPAHVSTSYSERNNLNIRMHSRRMTRLTNAFSKKIDNHAHAMALHFLYYNFVRVHKTLRMSPAMAAGVTKHLWEIGNVVDVLEAWEATRVQQFAISK
ncbi:MAG TPA: IS1 family transposase [Xanthobacteraceae bacterium]|nr:IS1 family transposase [Xanthobacteraceae bacterium]